MSLPCNRLSESSFSILGRRYQGLARFQNRRSENVIWRFCMNPDEFPAVQAFTDRGQAARRSAC
jgi:hypothetical protein